MSLAPSLSPVLLTTVLGFAYYRRIRANFGRQPWRPVRVGVRMALLCLLLLLLALAAVFVPQAGIAVSTGVAVGALLGWLALRHTKVDNAEGQRFYTPNPWIGGALSLLLLGRLAWRMGSGVFTGGAAQFGQNASPLTLGIFATLVGYYLVSGIGLALRMRALASPGALL